MGTSAPSALRPDRVLLGLVAETLDGALGAVARELAGEAGVPAERLVEALLERERTQSTALGRGVALPHARIASLSRSHVAVARLTRAIDLRAPDGLPVDLLLVVMSPAGEPADHVSLLAKLARRMGDASTLARLRSAPDAASVLKALDRD